MGLRGRSGGAGGELERVEAGGDVEGVVFERQPFQVALPQVRLGDPSPGLGQHGRGGIQAADDSAAVGRRLQGEAGAAPEVDEAGVGATAHASSTAAYKGSTIFSRSAAQSRARRPQYGSVECTSCTIAK
jgi:hypothetical protein